MTSRQGNALKLLMVLILVASTVFVLFYFFTHALDLSAQDAAVMILALATWIGWLMFSILKDYLN
jgi:hypothetical protein